MGIRLVIAMGIQLAALMWLTGCAGEIYVGLRPIDEAQQTMVMKDKSIACRYFNYCNNNGEK